MTKKKVEKPRREVTRQQLSLWQRQRRRQRLILGSGIFIIVAVVSIVISGWYINQYKPLQQTVIRVNDTEFNMGYYVRALEFHAKGQSAQNIPYLVDWVERSIQQNELIRQGTLKLDLSVSDKELNEELKNYDPPFNDAYRDIVRTQLLISKLRDEYFEQKVPVSTEQRHIMAMLLESESQTTEVRARLEGGESFSELASELSLDNFSNSNEGDLGWRPKGILPTLLGTPVLEDYVFSAEAGVLSQPIYDEAITKNVGYWLLKVSERRENPEQANIQAILLDSEKGAQKIRARIEAGEDFAALATELSQHSGSRESGGNLGWLTSNTTIPAIDEFIFNYELELETLSEPIRDELTTTKGGYWLIKVLNKTDDRQIEDADRDLLKTKLLDKWIGELWDNPENIVESYLNSEKKIWALDRV